MRFYWLTRIVRSFVDATGDNEFDTRVTNRYQHLFTAVSAISFRGPVPINVLSDILFTEAFPNVRKLSFRGKGYPPGFFADLSSWLEEWSDHFTFRFVDLVISERMLGDISDMIRSTMRRYSLVFKGCVWPTNASALERCRENVRFFQMDFPRRSDVLPVLLSLRASRLSNLHFIISSVVPEPVQRAIVSTVRSLPCLRQISLENTSGGNDTTAARIFAGLVCHKWRFIATATPDASYRSLHAMWPFASRFKGRDGEKDWEARAARIRASVRCRERLEPHLPTDLVRRVQMLVVPAPGKWIDLLNRYGREWMD